MPATTPSRLPHLTQSRSESISRCVWILLHAASENGLEIQAYHDRFGGSRRTFCRDLSRLAEADVIVLYRYGVKRYFLRKGSIANTLAR